MLALQDARADPAGHFSGSVSTEWMADGRHMLVRAPFVYTDGAGVDWPAPVGTEVDGASIPQYLWSAAGGPYEGALRGAAILHDIYCDTRARPWRQVNRAFYEALITSGLDRLTAKLMYLAVVYAGPRWRDDQVASGRLPSAAPIDPASARAVLESRRADAAPADAYPRPVYALGTARERKARFDRLSAIVKRRDPSLDAIDAMAAKLKDADGAIDYHRRFQEEIEFPGPGTLPR